MLPDQDSEFDSVTSSLEMELPFHRNRPTAGRDEDSQLEQTTAHEPKSSDLSSESPVPWQERVKHVTWATFTLPMSTGGVSLLLHSTPHQFRGLWIIGKIIYIFDIVLFLTIVGLITSRFIMTRKQNGLMRSLLHPTEALFFPTAWLALFDILALMQVYGVPSCGPWLLVALRILFWMYVALTFCSAVWQYWHLFTAPQQLTIQSMTPGWILPIFPVMLVGTFAATIAASQPPAQRMPIIIAGVTFQGLGWMVSFLMFAVYLHRLMQYGLPAPNLRPGMFIAVGPPSFTGIAIIGIANALPDGYGYFGAHPLAVPVLHTIADFAAIFLWALAFWFFCITVISVLLGARQMSFHLVWWAFVFPNTGFTIATIDIGRQMESPGILWVGSAMTILIVLTWIFVFVSHARAIVKQQIMMLGMDEDKEAEAEAEADEYQEDDRKHNIPTPPKGRKYKRPAPQ